MKRNQVILIYGLPASGKYTMAKHIQEKCGGILFDNHYFHDMFQNIIYVPEKRRPEYYEKIIMLRATFLDIIKTFYKSKDFITAPPPAASCRKTRSFPLSCPCSPD